MVLAGAGFLFFKSSVLTPNSDPVACTQEAKLCPDGSYVGRTGPSCEFTLCPSLAVSEFDKNISLNTGEKVTFRDGLILQLKEINDSRCKPYVQCFWAGELSALFILNGTDMNLSFKEVRLGTVNNKSVTMTGYKFTLENATETSANIIVSKIKN